ncbi:MAG TPA: cupin domain-containing protein [Mucilaginibacter sp.]|nr:cupin domain-containing protein [Mucilaginibacter sp.]
MKIKTNIKFIQLYLRVAIGLAYLWEVADRLGVLGAHGQPHVGWGDWQHFMDYARQTMSFLPPGIIPVLAVIATIGEGSFGLLILTGLFTRIAAIGSSVLSFCFALAMAISFGIDSPLGYSVFTLSAASLLLATLPRYAWSIDAWLEKKAIGKGLAANAAMFVLLTGLTMATLSIKAQQQPRITEKYLLRQFINEHGISDREVQMEVVNFPPRSSSPAHRHPCPTFGYLLQGELESVFEGKHHLYKQGDSFYESTNGLHAVTRNNSAADTAKLLVFFIAEKDKPTTIR